MAYWNSEERTIVYIPVQDWPGKKGWQMIDCGCCGGLQWGGNAPRECGDCHGAGMYAHHVASGALARYPGGPFIGRRVQR